MPIIISGSTGISGVDGSAAAGGTYVVGMYTGVVGSQQVAVCRNDENVTTPTDVASVHIAIHR